MALAHLADLLAERHAFEQIGDALVCCGRDVHRSGCRGGQHGPENEKSEVWHGPETLRGRLLAKVEVPERMLRTARWQSSSNG
jgi:hypothetical protein